MCVANEDLDMMDFLVVHGAHLDFRLGPKFNDKTILHIAAEGNKIKSLRVSDINQTIRPKL